ncbi:MAG TPA: TetR family transcriptional regulator [Acidimicrobiales bacterium]|nr:TetR family transcriptional regulator [Acidimicrobiales bacterium]
MDGGLREQKKAHTRQRLVQVALSLFEERGFDEVTVEEIADAAVVSPRTFYRYFGSKEAVLYDGQDDQLILLHEVITSQPPEEPPLAAIRAAVLVLARQVAGTAELSLRRARISASTTSLGEYQRSTLIPRWEQALTVAVAERLGVDPGSDPRPLLLAGIGLTVMASVNETFQRVGAADLEAVVLARFADLTDLVADQGAAPTEQPVTEPRTGAG